MRAYTYDLHIHSCLSPCGDDDMTVSNIAGMATLCGLDIVALADHNTCANCPAFFKAAERYGVVPVAAMELTTAEDIHVLCLFERLEDAMAFDSEVQSRRILIKNREDIFGRQLITDEFDNVTGTMEHLLINATQITVDEAPEVVARYNGLCIPAHIDRDTNGIIATLGIFPEQPAFPIVEVRDMGKMPELIEKHPVLQGKRFISDSDAHYLNNMRDGEATLELPDGLEDAAQIRSAMFALLRKE